MHDDGTKTISMRYDDKVLSFQDFRKYLLLPIWQSSRSRIFKALADAVGIQFRFILWGRDIVAATPDEDLFFSIFLCRLFFVKSLKGPIMTFIQRLVKFRGNGRVIHNLHNDRQCPFCTLKHRTKCFVEFESLEFLPGGTSFLFSLC